jgi:hypothetical protein
MQRPPPPPPSRDAKWGTEKKKKHKSFREKTKQQQQKPKQLRHFPHLDLDHSGFFFILFLFYFLKNMFNCYQIVG